MIGVYCIQNNINGHAYVGQSCDIERRWRRHSVEYLNPVSKAYGYPLYRAFRKYGIENFTFSIVEQCAIEELNQKEKYYIDKYDSCFHGYNQTLGGYNCGTKKDAVIKVIELLESTDKTHQEIADECNVSKDMVQGINTGRYWHYNREYPIQKKHKALFKGHSNGHLGQRSQGVAKTTCPHCGKPIYRTSQQCIKCRSLERKQNNPSAKQLSVLISGGTKIKDIAAIFDVTGKTIRVWCHQYNINFKRAPAPAKPPRPQKKVYMLDAETLSTLQVFNSCGEAYKFLGKPFSGHILRAIKNNGTCYGYRWRIEEV